MKTLWLLFVGSTILVGAEMSGSDRNAGPENDKKTLADDVQDDHGNLRWESWVKRDGSNGWIYGRELKNREPKLKCRVNWAPARWKTTLRAGETKKTGLDTPQEIPPDEYAGKISYNGGAAPGEGEAEAACIRPKEYKASDYAKGLAKKPISARADLAFDVADDSCAVHIFASSYFNELADHSFEYTYFLAFSPIDRAAQGALIRWLPLEGANGMRREFEEIVNSSKSAKTMSPIVTKTIDVEGEHFKVIALSAAPRVWSIAAVQGLMQKAGFPDRVSSDLAQFFKEQKIDGAIVLMNASIRSISPPTFRDDPIQFLTPRGGRDVLAEVLLPAWGPSK